MDELSASGAKRMKKCRNHHRDWSGLPRNVLLCIMDKLIVIDDYVRFSGVCHHWRFTFVEEISYSPSSSHPPFLLIAPPPQRGLALYSLSRERVYDFRLQVPHNKVCRGSSFGWLVTMETTPLGCGGIQLHNPFSNRIIHLPPLDSILQQHPEPGDINRRWYKYYLHKAVLSSDPTSSPHNFVIVAIMSKYFGLAFFKPGNTTWTSIGDDWHTHWSQGDAFFDVIFFRTTNQFYAGLNSGAVLSIDFLGDLPKLTQIAPQICGPRRVLTYLVEDLSSGDLFQVFKNFEASTKGSRLKRLVKYGLKRARNVHKFELKQCSTTITVQFSVFKLDAIDRNWIQVHDLGQNVIFLGKNASMLRSTSDCPGCEPNCIYYTDDDDDFSYRSNFENYGLPRDGIYNLWDGSVRPHYSSATSTVINSSSTSSEKTLPQAIWIQPTLRHC